jgi:hypothetical protein
MSNANVMENAGTVSMRMSATKMSKKTVEQVIKNYYLCLPVATKENVKLLIQEIERKKELNLKYADLFEKREKELLQQIESLQYDNQFTHQANKRQIEVIKKLNSQIAILSIGGTPTQ